MLSHELTGMTGHKTRNPLKTYVHIKYLGYLGKEGLMGSFLMQYK